MKTVFKELDQLIESYTCVDAVLQLDKHINDGGYESSNAGKYPSCHGLCILQYISGYCSFCL